MSHEDGTKYKEGEGGFKPVTYRLGHLNLNHLFYFILIHMSHEDGTKYKEGEGGFKPVTYRLGHLNLNH